MTFFDCTADLVGQLTGNGQKGMLQIDAPPCRKFLATPLPYGQALTIDSGGRREHSSNGAAARRSAAANAGSVTLTVELARLNTDVFGNAEFVGVDNAGVSNLNTHVRNSLCSLKQTFSPE